MQTKEYWREYQRRWRVNNPAKSREYSRQYRLRNRTNQEFLSHRNEYGREWRSKNPERWKELAHKSYRNQKEAAFLKLLKTYGNKCVCCGEGISAFLTLDHVNGHEVPVKERKKTSLIQVYNQAIREANPGKYQILCYNCNSGKWRNRGICPHKGS